MVTLVQPLHHLESGSDLSSREIVSFYEESTAAFMHTNCQLKLDNDSGCGSVTTTQTLESAESDNYTSLSSSIETDLQQDRCPPSYNGIYVTQPHVISDYQKVEIDSLNSAACPPPATVKELTQDELFFDDEFPVLIFIIDFLFKLITC